MVVKLGIKKGSGNYDDKDYKKVYLSDLKVGEQITGEVKVSDIQRKDWKGNEIISFYFIVIDHANKTSWVLSINTSYYENKDGNTIYGAKGGRVYMLIDTLSNALNGTPLGELDSYSVIFDDFRKDVNEKVNIVTVRTVQPDNPNAKTPNIAVITATEKNNLGIQHADEEPEVMDMSFDPMEYSEDVQAIANELRKEKQPLTRENVIAKARQLWQELTITDSDMKNIKKELNF